MRMPESVKRASTSDDDVVYNLYVLFNAAWEENINGHGTSITKMVTEFVPDAIQNLQAYRDICESF